jgi:antitoxin component YwqK of YwqJK toxin-antitoxin module
MNLSKTIPVKRNLRSAIRNGLMVVALACCLSAAQSSAQDLVPVERKNELNWGQPPLSSRGSRTFGDAEEIAAPEPDGYANAAVSPQEEEGPLSLGPINDVDREVIDGQSDGPALGGASEVIRQRYPDGKVQIERHVRQDENGSFMNHGPWVLKSQRGDVMAKGQFENGKMSGMWQRWHPAGAGGLFAEEPFSRFRGPFLSVCSFAEGKPHGEWMVMDGRRNKIFELSFTLGKRDGTASWYWPNGARMRQVQYVEGQLSGDWIEWDTNRQITRRTSYDKNRELVIRQTWYHREQPQTEYHFLGPPLQVEGADDWWNARLASFRASGEEERHGPSREWYVSGQKKMQGQYRHGKEQGEFSWWFENGQRQLGGSFVDGARQGVWRWWHANGQVAVEGEYHQDKPVGKWVWRDEEGKVTEQKELAATPAEEIQGMEASARDDLP